MNNYKQYLNSDYWKRVKQAVFLRALKNGNSTNMHGICEQCGYEPFKPILQVHHKTYEFRGNELDHLDSVILLCPRCHATAHGRELHSKREGVAM